MATPPAPFDLSNLVSKYTITSYKTHSNTSIFVRTSSILSTLFPPPSTNNTKEKTTAPCDNDAPAKTPPLVKLTASSKTANKLISIVEIAKREAQKASPGRKIFQYTELTSEMVEIPRLPAARDTVKSTIGNGTALKQDGEALVSNEEGEAFETMPSNTSTMKLRRVPVLTVYLAAASVRELKGAFG
jgi:hypothetical protein